MSDQKQHQPITDPLLQGDLRSYIRNLDEISAKQALFQAIAYPENRPFFINCAKEWGKFMTHNHTTKED